MTAQQVKDLIENSVTVVCTRVGLEGLRAKCQPEDLSKALFLHDALIAKLISCYNGCKMRQEEGSFLVSFNTPHDALTFSEAVQSQLLEEKWPEGILGFEECAKVEQDGKIIFRGLRVGMGVHCGFPTSIGSDTTRLRVVCSSSM